MQEKVLFLSFQCEYGHSVRLDKKNAYQNSKTSFGNLSGFLLQLLWCSSECELVWPNDHRVAVYIVQRARHVN